MTLLSVCVLGYLVTRITVIGTKARVTGGPGRSSHSWINYHAVARKRTQIELSAATRFREPKSHQLPSGGISNAASFTTGEHAATRNPTQRYGRVPIALNFSKAIGRCA